MYGNREKNSSCLNLNLKIWWAYYTDLPDHVHPKIIQNYKSSFRYDSYKFALQVFNPTSPEGKREFEWPLTPSFEVNP